MMVLDYMFNMIIIFSAWLDKTLLIQATVMFRAKLFSGKCFL